MKTEVDMSVHSCSFYCTNPPCIKAQRDEMRAEMEAMQAKLARVEALAEQYDDPRKKYGFGSRVSAELLEALRGEHE